MDTDTLFQFIAENPPMALICGGILCLILGATSYPFSHTTGNILLSWAPWLIAGGILLQVIWLFRRVISGLIQDLS